MKIIECAHDTNQELNSEYVIPAPFDPRVGSVAAEAVYKAARESGVARI